MQETPQVIVVGAAVVRDGLLLAARRTAPSTLAGGWELPGGKVEPGEGELEALVRECREELGIDVRPVRRCGQELVTASGYLLRTWLCALDSGEPVLRDDHDALCWLGPEQINDVGWLAADLALLPALREVLLDGEPLGGGLVSATVRVGGTVRRPTGVWTPAVHELLRHLAAAGLRGVPAVLGRDERGREVLDFVPGSAVEPQQVPREALLGDVGRWLAELHAASASFPGDAPRRWRRGELRLAPEHVICHNDVSPANIVVRDGRLVAVIDWDMAAPGHPMDDVAYAAWQFVLSRSRGDHVDAAGLTALAAGYGVDPVAVLKRVAPRLRGALSFIRRGAEEGDAGLQRLLASGVVEATQTRLTQLRGREEAIRRALSSLTTTSSPASTSLPSTPRGISLSGDGPG